MPRSSPLAALGALTLLLASCAQTGTAEQTSAARAVVDVSVSDCGSSWHPTGAGRQKLALHNADKSAGDVQLVGRGAHSGLVYADVEPFGPGTTVELNVSLAAGSYALACLMEDEPPVTGPTLRLRGKASGVPGVRILTQSQLVPATQRYESWLRTHVRRLVRHARWLRARADAGDLRGARAAWLTAHLDYQRLGAAYSAFGDLGDRIDGLPDGLPGGRSNPRWAGFHRVEADLWQGERARLHADVADLDRAIAVLPRLVSSTRLDPGTVTLRGHEIAENALQVQLTGEDDFGSHSDLLSVRAELMGTRAVLNSLRGPINTSVAHPGRIRHALARTLRLFSRTARAHAATPVRRLPRVVRERLDASLGLLVERLATVPASLEPRLTVASEQLEDGGH